jgi:HK97 gp10 family phage protein
MIEIKSNLKDEFSSQLDAFASNVRDRVLISGAAGMAQVIYDEAVRNAPVSEKQHFFYGSQFKKSGGRSGKYGPYLPGALQRAIYRTFSRERSTDDRAVYRVLWRTQKPPIGVPYGYMVEFGTSRAAARPFMRPARNRMDDAIREGMDRMRARMGQINK